MIKTVSQIKDELADREAIRECLYRYSRGADRCDEEVLRSAYWPDATDDHLAFSGTREELIAWMMPIMKGGMEQTMHMIGNILFLSLEGNVANTESYFYGFHRIIGEDGARRDTIGSGRYLDRLEKRNDEWRIAKRVVATDWFRDYPDSADWETGPFGMKVPPGGRYPDDVSYSFVKG